MYVLHKYTVVLMLCYIDNIQHTCVVTHDVLSGGNSGGAKHWGLIGR